MTLLNMTNSTGKSPQGLTPTQRTIGNSAKLGVGEVALTREKHTNWLPNASWAALKIHMQVTLYGLNKSYLVRWIDR